MGKQRRDRGLDLVLAIGFLMMAIAIALYIASYIKYGCPLELRFDGTCPK